MSSVPSLQATCKAVLLFDILTRSIFAPCKINKENTSGWQRSIAAKSGYAANLTLLLCSVLGVYLYEKPMSVSLSAFGLIWAPINREKTFQTRKVTIGSHSSKYFLPIWFIQQTHLIKLTMNMWKLLDYYCSLEEYYNNIIWQKRKIKLL